jgi:hypothetical protein
MAGPNGGGPLTANARNGSNRGFYIAVRDVAKDSDQEQQVDRQYISKRSDIASISDHYFEIHIGRFEI